MSAPKAHLGRCGGYGGLLLLLVLLLSPRVGASSGQEEVPRQAMPPAAGASEPPLTEIYRVGPEDVLEILLANDPEVPREYRVSSGGYIFFPYVGNIAVAGKTTSEIEDQLKRLLRNGFFENPELVVAVKEYRSHRVYLLGDMGTTGPFILKRERVPLIEILASAGVRPTARRVTLTRWSEGRPVTLTISLDAPEKYTMLVQSGDVVEVHSSREYIFITGEIRTPQAIEYTPGLTLSQAIIHAGGPTEFAKRSKVQIRRRRADGTIEILRADLDRILRGQSPDVELKPGDTVLIPRRFF